MDQIKFLTRQTEGTYQWINRLIDPIDYEKWDDTPDVVASNISWQVGHLIMSLYYHTIMCTVGHRKEILMEIPLREYANYFDTGLPQKAMGQFNPGDLHLQFKYIQKQSLEIIDSLTSADLERPLEPTRMPHPIAKTKYETIDWNIKHTMWHAGQIALIKRVIDEPHDFGR